MNSMLYNMNAEICTLFKGGKVMSKLVKDVFISLANIDNIFFIKYNIMEVKFYGIHTKYK